MKSVIIATGNEDKYAQIKGLLTTLKINSNSFLSLKDLNITNGEAETGSMMDRAKQKALYCLSQIPPQDYGKYLCIVANDTGTSLPTLNIKTEESKKVAAQILADEILKPGDPIVYVYTYVFILFPNQKMITAEAEIPFTYLGNPEGLRVDENKSTNVMSRVKAIPGQNVPHSQIPVEEEIAYRLKYLKESLAPIIEEINK